MKKPRIGVFIDAGNLYHTSARIGWRIDFGKLKNLLAHAMAWELRLKNHMFFELIKEYVEYGITTNPDLSAGATLTRLIIAKAIAESSTSRVGVDKSKPRKRTL